MHTPCNGRGTTNLTAPLSGHMYMWPISRAVDVASGTSFSLLKAQIATFLVGEWAKCNIARARGKWNILPLLAEVTSIDSNAGTFNRWRSM